MPAPDRPFYTRSIFARRISRGIPARLFPPCADPSCHIMYAAVHPDRGDSRILATFAACSQWRHARICAHSERGKEGAANRRYRLTHSANTSRDAASGISAWRGSTVSRRGGGGERFVIVSAITSPLSGGRSPSLDGEAPSPGGEEAKAARFSGLHCHCQFIRFSPGLCAIKRASRDSRIGRAGGESPSLCVAAEHH
jgi:hypothetical protein